jgi:23S rRNA-/tRNA-specific pseudouridylate synthase
MEFPAEAKSRFLCLKLDILYRDEHIVVIDKPPDLLVHRSEIDRHETRFAIQILRDQIGNGSGRHTAWIAAPPAYCYSRSKR